MRRSVGLLGLAALMAAGCSASTSSSPIPTPPPAASAPPTGTPTTGPTTSPTTRSTTSPTAPSDSGSIPTGPRLATAECLRHTYRLASFEASSGAYESGRGGDVTIRYTGKQFPDGAYVETYWTLRGGSRPVRLAGRGGSATLRLSGTVKGTYTLQGGEATFAQDSATGSATITPARTATSAGPAARKLTASAAAEILSPTGVAEVGCTKQVMTLVARSARFELVRI